MSAIEQFSVSETLKLFGMNLLWLLVSSVTTCVIFGTALFSVVYLTTHTVSYLNFAPMIFGFIMFGHAVAGPGLIAYFIISLQVIMNGKAGWMSFAAVAFLVAVLDYLIMSHSFLTHSAVLARSGGIFGLFLPVAGLVTASLHWFFIKKYSLPVQQEPRYA